MDNYNTLSKSDSTQLTRYRFLMVDGASGVVKVSVKIEGIRMWFIK